MHHNTHILQATRFISDILVKHSKYLNLSKVFPPSLESEDEWSKKYIDSPEYKFLSRRMPQDLINDVEKINTSKIKIHFMRNIAMSIEGLDRDLIYRFMFLSLLNLGIATVSLLLLLIWWLAYYLSHDVVMTIEYRPWYLIVMIFIFLLFIDRSYNFYKRALITPFSMAVEYFRRDCSNYQELKKNISIYLAGGFKSSWQDSISNQFPDIRFLDPRSHKLTDPIEYTNWDLQAIRESHIIFAYLEKDNPGGYALALEVGYAKALGKHIIFIDEKTIPNSESSRYYDMIRASASVLCSTLEDGKSYLENYLKIYNKL